MNSLLQQYDPLVNLAPSDMHTFGESSESSSTTAKQFHGDCLDQTTILLGGNCVKIWIIAVTIATSAIFIAFFVIGICFLLKKYNVQQVRINVRTPSLADISEHVDNLRARIRSLGWRRSSIHAEAIAEVVLQVSRRKYSVLEDVPEGSTHYLTPPQLYQRRNSFSAKEANLTLPYDRRKSMTTVHTGTSIPEGKRLAELFRDNSHSSLGSVKTATDGKREFIA